MFRICKNALRRLPLTIHLFPVFQQTCKPDNQYSKLDIEGVCMGSFVTDCGISTNINTEHFAFQVLKS